VKAFESLFSRRRGKRNAGASTTVMVVGLGSLIVVLGLSLLVTYSVLEIKTGIRAYVSGESLWSKGKEDAVYFTHRYIDTGERHYLDRAREGLAIPMGDMTARLALEQSDVDLAVARQGFEQGGNHPEDVPRLIWLFNSFHEVSDFRKAISIWRATDEYILRLDELIEVLDEGLESDRQLAATKKELNTIRSELRPLEKAFSTAMGAADRRFNNVLFVTVGMFLAMVAVLAMTVFSWAARRVAVSENELRATLEHAGVGMAVLQRSGRIQTANEKLCEILAYPKSRLQGMYLSDIMASLHAEIEVAEVFADLAYDKEVTLDRHCVAGGRQPLWLRFTFSAMAKNDGFIMVLEDISDERSRMAALAYEASHDPLTGLLNRREFYRRLKMALETAESESTRHALCMIDLDRFKEINDSCGHAAGDDFLQKLGRVIRRPLREGDVLARLGGDEFAVIFSYCPMDVALKIAEGLRDEVESFRFEWDGRRFHVTLSAGLVELGPAMAQLSPDHILDVADSACYWAKQQGRNRIYVVPPDELTQGSSD